MNNQKGYIISAITFFVLIAMLTMALAASFLVAMSQKKATNSARATQSHYAAESGIEDALLRLKNTPSMSPLSYGMAINGADVSVVIPSTIGSSKRLTSQAINRGIIKTFEVISSIDNNGENVSFYYGVEVGEGGLVMSNGTEVMGNVFSGGNISGSGTIDNNAVVSGNGNSIDDVHVKGNVLAYSCLSHATVDGNLIYVEGGTHTCDVGGTTTSQQQEISQQPLPIPVNQINEWKTEAALIGQTINGNVIISEDQNFGPVKVVGNLMVDIGVTLNIKGVVYVTGTIVFKNNAKVKLDPLYGSSGGVIISDSTITTNNNNVFSGSGQAGSYIMLISTSSSNLAIDVQNNVEGVVLYTTNGGITIHNNVSVTEATGYKVILLNNAKVQYSSGLVNIYFASGPGGGWKVTSWQEQ